VRSLIFTGAEFPHLGHGGIELFGIELFGVENGDFWAHKTDQPVLTPWTKLAVRYRTSPIAAIRKIYR
jgi:hypothetical protein